MRAACASAVAAAIGRPITQAEAKGIEERVRAAMKQAARTDPNYAAMTAAQKLQAGAALATQQLLAEAGKKRQRAALTVQTVGPKAQAVQAAGKDGFRTLADYLEQADILKKGVERFYFSQMMDAWRLSAPKWLGLVESKAGQEALVRELYGQNTGILEAKAAAKAVRDSLEQMRQRWNAGGGDTGKLDYAYIPQHHNSVRVREVGRDTWAQETLPLLDRSRYVNEDGSRMTDAQVLDFLRGAYQTIATEGLNKLTPGAPKGSGMIANRHSDARQVHFADADAWLAYHAKYGEGSVFSVLQSHVAGLARDIALVETLGPNPAHTFQALHDQALLGGGRDLIGPFGVGTESMWREISGFSSQVYNAHNPAYQRMASIAQGVRNVEVFGKLQGAFLSSVTDIPTFFLTLGFNRLPLWQGTVNLLRSLGDMREWANRHGLVSESVISDMNRWAENNTGTGWTGKLSQATMRASLLQGFTDAVRRAFSVTMMAGLGKLSRTDWAALESSDRAHLAAKGITAADWAVVRQATPETWRGQQMLTPEAVMAVQGVDEIAKQRTVSKLLAAIVDESEYASVNPDLQTRAALHRGTQKGTFTGEMARSIALFKSFPVAMISRHWGRAFDEGAVGGTAYATKLAVGLTVFGALALTAKDLASGKDPREMDKAKFWGAAMAQGGGLGILGDTLYTGLGGQSRYGEPNWTNLAGPVFGSLIELGNLTLGNVSEALQGKDTHVGAESVRFARSHLPFLNLWYAKTVIDHLFMQDLQEWLSPGHNARLEQRAQKEWGQGYWWRPGSGPEDARAPNVANAWGE